MALIPNCNRCTQTLARRDLLMNPGAR